MHQWVSNIRKTQIINRVFISTLLFYLIGYSCLLTAAANADLFTGDPDPCVRQSRDLSFVSNKLHKPFVVAELNRMSQKLDEAVELFSDHDIAGTMLCNAGVIIFFEDHSFHIERATRDKDEIHYIPGSSPKKVMETTKEIFCPSDRKNQNLWEQLKKTKRWLDEHLHSIKNSPLHLKNPSSSTPVSLNTFDVTNFNPWQTYAGQHFDDAEGHAVDQLVKALEFLFQYTLSKKANKITEIYPLFCCERDLCRYCLVSIRNFLVPQIKKIYKEATKKEFTGSIIPIAVTKSVYHEKYSTLETKHALFRKYYYWYGCEPTQTQQDGVVGASQERQKQSCAQVVKKGAPKSSTVEPKKAESTIIYLCRLGLLSQYPENETGRRLSSSF